MKILFIFCALLTLVGCGKAKQADVKKVNLETTAAKEFPAENLMLTTNVFFIWKKGVTGAQISEVRTAGDQFAGLKMQRDALNAGQQPIPPEIDQQLGALKQKLAGMTEKFTVVPLIKLIFVDGKLTVTLTGWQGTVGEATYDPKGGKVNFVATDPTGDTYEFKIARSKYELAAKNLVSFYGDLIVKTGGETRYGVVKLLGPKPK